jgi:predicted transcriptional regulator
MSFSIIAKFYDRDKAVIEELISFEQLNEYINELLDNELLVYDFHTRTYRITPKGMKFLELYAELEEVH